MKAKIVFKTVILMCTLGCCFPGSGFSQVNISLPSDSLDKTIDQLKLAIHEQIRAKDELIFQLKRENDSLSHLLDSIQMIKPALAAKLPASLKKVIGSEILRTIIQSSATIGYLLAPREQDKENMSTPGYYLGYRVLDSANTGFELKPALINEKNYDFDALQKMCAFNPYVAYKFDNKTNIVTVLVDFSCDELVFFLNNKRMGKFNAVNMRSAILKTARQVFTQAKTLEGLQ